MTEQPRRRFLPLNETGDYSATTSKPSEAPAVGRDLEAVHRRIGGIEWFDEKTGTWKPF